MANCDIVVFGNVLMSLKSYGRFLLNICGKVGFAARRVCTCEAKMHGTLAYFGPKLGPLRHVISVISM